jgi:hypothetical protein
LKKGIEGLITELNNIVPLLKQLDYLSITLEASQSILSSNLSIENSEDCQNSIFNLKECVDTSKSSIIHQMGVIRNYSALQIANKNIIDLEDNTNNNSITNISDISSSTNSIINSSLSSENITTNKLSRKASAKGIQQSINQIPNKINN